MNLGRLSLLVTAAAMLGLSAGAGAQEAEKAPEKATETKEAARARAPNRSVTRHSGTFGGQRINYVATAGETFLKDKDGNPRASIFSISYVREGRDPNRPVTFLFNGGPGSGSLWLHMGAFGPKRVAIPSDARDDVVNQLEGTFNDVALNGVLLISTVLDFGAGADTPGNEMTHILNLPSMAATALYHGKAQAASNEAFVEEARRWAIGPYASALLKGQRISSEERTAVRRDLARFTGLSEAYLDQADLRVTPARFYKELLRDRGLTIGRLDSRYTGRDYDNAGETPDNDPSFYGIDAGYTAALNAHVRDTLKYRTDKSYVTIGGIGGQWDWRIGGGRDNDVYLNVAPYLGRALRENSGMRIFVGQGYYDFATPFFAAEYSLTRTGIPQDRIEYRYYGSGHMMYVRDQDRVQLSRDIREFIRRR
jgi:carboxypeptidase C (cathepsin A)